MKKVMHVLVRVFVVCFVSTLILLFATPIGHELRVTVAEMVMSSQHRHLAKYTFLSQKELDAILYNIQNPKYINSASTEKKKDSKAKTVKKEKKDSVKENNLVIKVETLKKKISPTYFYEGKLVEISNPMNVKLVSSSKENHGEQIFVIAERVNALLAINASGFVDQNGRGNGGSATGVVIENGIVKNKYSHIEEFVAGLTGEGEMITGKYSADELISLGVKHAAGFKPQLIVNGQKMINRDDGGWGIGPRTAIGQKEDGTIVMVVIDGRQPNRSLGATLEEVQDILYERGVTQAMAMDGGSSSSMYFNGENITIPSSRNHVPRYLPNIWAVIPEKGQELKVIVDGVETSVGKEQQ